MESYFRNSYRSYSYNYTTAYNKLLISIIPGIYGYWYLNTSNP